MKFRVLSALLFSVCAVPLAAQPAPLEQPGKWAQDYTGRKADPSVRFGTLPNGLRYAIMHNETPTDGVAMRMRIGAGSLQERDDEQGLAHFIEHMVFRGSANVADGEAVRMLQRQGLSYGPDTNAFTSHDQTVFMFNFPKANAEALDTGLTLFREIGGRLSFSPAAIDAERGVVLSEERLRDTAQYHAVKGEFATVLDGTRANQRWTIGKPEVLRTATRDRFERFYRANYRPDNATIVIVGNIDPAAVEQQIRARFSDWKVDGTPDAIDLGTPSGAKKVGEVVETGAPDSMSLHWVGPVDRRADTDALEREYVLRRLALTVFNQRLSEIALKPNAPFLGGQASSVRSLVHEGQVTSIEVSGAPEKWQAALDTISAEQRTLLRDGVQPNELKRAVSTLRTAFENAAATAATRKSPDIADAILNEVNEEEVYTNPAQDLALIGPVLASATPAQVDAAFKQAFAGRGPILFRTASKSPVGEAQLGSALTAAYTRPLGAAVKEAAIVWPYTDFGKPSAIVSRTVDAKLGTTIVRFANGTRLLVKPTTFEKGKVSVGVLFGNGRVGVPAALGRAIWQTQLFSYSGTGKLSTAQITQWAQENGKLFNIALSPSNRAFALVGGTRPADLVTQLQALDAFARDPGFRPEATDKAKALAKMIVGQIAGNPGTSYGRAAQAMTVGNDPRFRAIPSNADLARIEPQDMSRVLKASLAGQADVVIVGDVTVDQAIDATKVTFASGPGGTRIAPAAARVTFPAPTAAPIVVEHDGRADQAYYGEYYRLPDYAADPAAGPVGSVAAAIISSRLVDTVREQLGITYSPQVEAVSAVDLAGYGYLGITLETPPANFAKIHEIMAAQLRDLAAKPVTADELARAKQPLIEGDRKKRETNAFWLGTLAGVARDSRVETATLGMPARLAAVSAADVQSLIARYAAGRQPVVVIARAKASSAAAPPAKP